MLYIANDRYFICYSCRKINDIVYDFYSCEKLNILHNIQLHVFITCYYLAVDEFKIPIKLTYRIGCLRKLKCTGL